MKGNFFFLTGTILVHVEIELVPGFGSLLSARWSMFLWIVSPGTNIPNHIWRNEWNEDVWSAANIWIPKTSTVDWFIQMSQRIGTPLWVNKSSGILKAQGRSDPDSKQKQSQGLYQSHSMCDHLWHLWRSQNFTILDLWPRLFLWILFSYFCKTSLVTIWSQTSQMVTHSNLTSTTLFLFLFSRKWFGINEIQQSIPESKLCFCFLFGIWIRTTLKSFANGTFKSIKLWVKSFNNWLQVKLTQSWTSGNLWYSQFHLRWHVRKSSLKAQRSKLERPFSPKRGKRNIRALSFELWNSRIRKCHPNWDRLYQY